MDAVETPTASAFIGARLAAVEELINRPGLSPEGYEYLHGKKDAYESALRDIEFCHDYH